MAVLIVVIVVVVLALIAFAVALPRIRERARIRAGEREIDQRRERAAGEHREVAGQHAQQANEAEQHARIAQQEAARARAEADLQEQHAQLHEQGMADDRLISPDERERFEGTSAVPARDQEPADGPASSRNTETGAAREGDGETAREQNRTTAN